MKPLEYGGPTVFIELQHFKDLGLSEVLFFTTWTKRTLEASLEGCTGGWGHDNAGAGQGTEMKETGKK